MSPEAPVPAPDAHAAAHPQVPLPGMAALLRTLARALLPLLPAGAPRALCPPPGPPLCPQPALGFRTKGILRKRCRDCYRVKRRGRWFIYCATNPRHKQRQM